MISTDDVLSERISPDGRVRWQARRSSDRGRLVVVGVVAPSDEPTLVHPLTEFQLRALLEWAPGIEPGYWICARCGNSNAADRPVCESCSRG